MTELSVTPVMGPSDPRIPEVVAAFALGDYRRYPSVSKKAATTYLTGQIGALLSLPEGAGWIAVGGSAALGLATLTPLPWESRFFGMNMASLNLFVSARDGSLESGAARALCRCAVSAAREAGVVHVSTRLDSESTTGLHALEWLGFRVMDTLVTFAIDPRRSRLAPFTPKHEVRPYESSDLDAVLGVARRAFAEYRSRFAADPTLPRAAVERFYLEWTERCCDGTMADRMLVALRRGRVIGFLGWRVHHELSDRTGIRVMGGGLGACLPRRFHAYKDLLWSAAKSALDEADAIDVETQVHNVVTMGFYQELGFLPVRARYALHLSFTG